MKRKVLLMLFGFIIGIIVSGTCVYAATLYEAVEVAYDNKNSGSSSSNVQGALDELYNIAKNSEQYFPEGYVMKTGSRTISSDIYPILGTASVWCSRWNNGDSWVNVTDNNGHKYVECNTGSGTSCSRSNSVNFFATYGGDWEKIKTIKSFSDAAGGYCPGGKTVSMTITMWLEKAS